MGSSVAIGYSGRKNDAFGGLLLKTVGYALALRGCQRQNVEACWVCSGIDVDHALLCAEGLLLDQLTGRIVDGQFRPRCSVQLVGER